MTKRRRVPAMAPEDRRAALIAATLPLLREYGTEVSTRQIAEAAGVAEGTIFGVFPDKASLLRAALMSAFDPQPAVDALAAIGTHIELRARLREAVAMLRAGMSANAKLLAGPNELMADDAGFRERMMDNRRRIQAGLAALVEPDRDRLRRSPEATAQLLLMLIAVSVHRGFGQGGESGDMDDEEIVSVLLDGLLVRPAPTPSTESTS
ncbi:TetR/AcrR family transcriptional regulator [Nonomuraea sp. NEAU-A123]|uniref:TetR/AcrR family transcriptional regulator n=1 Tax=Nonomuraea sp. NEAU-A123 TaxID=2839649 RepID=UPI001BE41B83|nr:TetR/AcrR family transcriptional regulator [Nonomuraea sp. NEAU-A123]MBT2227748.1 TetR/AcrR family transcriptional regulator [Nonomuraea sp. NEAU-A123]